MLARNTHSATPVRGFVRALFVFLALGGLFIIGCGGEVYQKRLDDTKMMFAHQEQLNSNLQGAWSDSETGISLRVPLRFEVLAPPVKPQREPKKGDEAEKDVEDDVIDNRQPAYMNIGFPGLRGAFRATFKAFGDGNSQIEGEGFIYVLSNHHLYEQIDVAKEFDKSVAQVLSEALHKEIGPNDWHDDHFPVEGKAKASFVRSLLYRNISLTSDEPISGYPRQFTAYFFDQGEIMVTVLCVFPKDVDPSEKLTERMQLCLETLGVSGNKLTAPSASGGASPGAAPSTSF